ncbi:interleukin-1 receptor accessory protein-like [Macrobrachium nipponense]|uniref:interleukin-1 receptor accessory protein-like n=1 Tax=Macrobrachium nipponense TaxID=159736 RepID=UPI0030C8A7A2
MIMNGLHRASIIFFLPFLLDVPRVEAGATMDDCICSSYSFEVDAHLRSPGMRPINDKLVGVGRSQVIICCAQGVLGRETTNSSFTVSWFLNGTPLLDSQSTFEPKTDCRNETLSSKAAKMSDRGNYTCIVTTAEGEQASETTQLIVISKGGNHEGVKGVEIDKCKSEASCVLQARLSQKLNITCSALVGSSSSYMEWLPRSCSTKLQPCLEFDEVKVKDGSDFMTNTMTIRSVTKEHFTTFTCLADNAAGPPKNKTITIQEEEPTVAELAALVCIMLMILVFIIAFALSRCHWALALWAKSLWRKRFPTDSGDFIHDVFLVYANSATPWVMNYLLPVLETTHGYKCYVPDRDMLAGEDFAETVCEKLAKSRRVLVIVSPSLLDSMWDVWTVLQSINTYLTSQIGVVAAILEAKKQQTYYRKLFLIDSWILRSFFLLIRQF